MRNRLALKRTMLASGRGFAMLPVYGVAVTSHTPTDSHPWLLSRELGSNPAGGKALKWWGRVYAHKISIDVSGTGLLSAPVNFSVTDIPLPRLGLFGDERDRTLATEHGHKWNGGSTGFTSEIHLFTDDAIGDGSVVSPAVNFYITETHIAPAWLFSAEFTGGGYSLHIRGYSPPLAGYTQVGSGTMDGETFNTWVDTTGGSAWTVDTCLVTITPHIYYSHGGTYDTSTGDYAPGVATNRF